MREVYINNQLVDITDKSTEGYIFNSPIFRDFDKINGNRTATYKLPKTNKNLRIIGLANNPDVESKFPYEKHKLSEYRDGLPFIVDADCQLLSCKGNDLEFSVTWGNITKIKDLKGVKLRDLEEKKDKEWLPWNNNISFLSASETDKKSGYLYVDFGQGFENKEYIHPSVSVRYILDLIKERRGISFEYPPEFEEMFKRTWIPLVEKNPGQPTYDDYTSEAMRSGVGTAVNEILPFPSTYNYVKLSPLGISKHDVIKKDCINWKNGETITVSGVIFFRDNNPPSYNRKAVCGCITTPFDRQRIIDTKLTEVEGIGGVYSLEYSHELTYTKEDPDLCTYIAFGYQSIGKSFEAFNSPEVTGFSCKVTLKRNEIKFGEDRFPIIANLPDISVIDFIKSLMQMFGVFTYITPETDTVKFISIDDMYKNKDKAYDWTNKLIQNSEGRYITNYLIDGYAQKNHLRYSDKDKDVVTKADGVLLVGDMNLEQEKDLFMLPYSASDNIKDVAGNEYARIPVYVTEGDEVEYNKVNYRVLYEGKYKTGEENESKSGYFAPRLLLNGEKGLISKYYTRYEQVVKQPIAVQCNVKLSDIAMSKFDPQIPVYIEGTYYMPIKVTMQTDGKATCQLIKMP